MDSASYKAEAELQRLLAESPSIISISEIRGDVPPLMLAIRELGLPGSGNTDLLAFSPKGDIAVVECKLAANAEIKRKVIAQVLEYGAYLWGMSYDELNILINRRENKNLADLMAEAVGDPEWDEESFRQTIQQNLSDGSFILVIAVDEMNDELSRTIRFINNCGHPEFAFTALEMKRFQAAKTEILVPHLFTIIKDQPPKATKSWTESSFLEATRQLPSKETVKLIEDLYYWTKKHADRTYFGTGTTTGSVTFHYLKNNKTVSVFSLFTNGTMTINLGALNTEIDKTFLDGFFHGITAIPSLKNLPADYKKFPNMKVEDMFIKDAGALQQFKQEVLKLGAKVHKDPAPQI